MKVKAIAGFFDIEAGVDRAIGDEFEATEQRFKAINAAGYGDLVKKVAAPRKKAAKKADEEE